ncbi:hypothetical protein HK099_004428 [Clydaea vesicula]|uniref:Ammonium transporter AmtB-like domain-containing protein n=1 Tax=Clydaea vesicula TaxID=447962 RepID=A0AAD5U388_9FUNG|nr:hypothetical protein HK099_004428 [Clydaea vesicula]
MMIGVTSRVKDCIHTTKMCIFGFLMTFLKKYGFSSLGLTFLICSTIIQFYPIMKNIMHNFFLNNFYNLTKFYLNVEYLILSDFCAASVMITFGAILGKVSATQMLIIGIFETIFYSLNEEVATLFNITDVGGGLIIHMFGCFFGVACSKLLTPSNAKTSKDSTSNHSSDLFAMLGTIFLWVYWPSFNGALATGDSRNRAVVNTVLSLTGSCVSTFIFSKALRDKRKFHISDIQNATLAGGVAIGSCANLPISPSVALGIGFASGWISTLGFTKLQSLIEKHLGLHDTCGVLYLHGIPGMLSGISNIIIIYFLNETKFSSEQTFISIFPLVHSNKLTFQQQSINQLYCFLITLLISLVGGIITGVFVKLVTSNNNNKSSTYFNDIENFELSNEDESRFLISENQLDLERADSATNATNYTALENRLKILEEKIINLTGSLPNVNSDHPKIWNPSKIAEKNDFTFKDDYQNQNSIPRNTMAFSTQRNEGLMQSNNFNQNFNDDEIGESVEEFGEQENYLKEAPDAYGNSQNYGNIESDSMQNCNYDIKNTSAEVNDAEGMEENVEELLVDNEEYY